MRKLAKYTCTKAEEKGQRKMDQEAAVKAILDPVLIPAEVRPPC